MQCEERNIEFAMDFYLRQFEFLDLVAGSSNDLTETTLEASIGRVMWDFETRFTVSDDDYDNCKRRYKSGRSR